MTNETVNGENNDMEPRTVHEQLTALLLDAGCTVSKPAIDKLVRWVADRDTSIIEALQKRGDEMKNRAKYDYGIDLTPKEPTNE